MPYKYTQSVYFKNEEWESLPLGHVISDADYEKIPQEYRSSWKHTVDKPTHSILLEERCIYCCVEIEKDSSRQENIKNWFKNKI